MMQLKLGHDGLGRVALVKTSRGELTRYVSKLGRLPAVKDNTSRMQTLKVMHTRSSNTNDNETACLVENVNATGTYYETLGLWFEPCTCTHSCLALARRFQFPKPIF